MSSSTPNKLDGPGYPSAPDLNPKAYMFKATDVHIWPKYIYQALHVEHAHRVWRTLVTICVGLVEFLVGLAFATVAGFSSTYLRSPAVYLFVFSLSFAVDACESLYLRMFDVVKTTREIFIVSDKVFAEDTGHIVRRLGRFGITIPLTVLSFLVVWSITAVVYLAPGSTLGRALTVLRVSTLPAAWFSPPDLVGKMLTLDWFLSVATILTIPLIYSTIVAMQGVLHLTAQWDIVPIPAYVSTRLRPAATYLFVGASIYALCVVLLSLLFGGTEAPLVIGIVLVFVLVGLLVALTPVIVVQRLAIRARDQLTSSVSGTYYHTAYPIAAGDLDAYIAPESDERWERYQRLLRLQELMRATNEATGIEVPFAILIPALLSQGLPLLSLFLSARR